MAYLYGISRELVRTAMEAPFLERNDERELIAAWCKHKDQRALDRLIDAHMRLVISLAAKSRHYGLSVADLTQEGVVGIMEAAKRFEPARDVRFSTYATWWIRAAIQEYILRNWSIVRGGTSSSQKALFFNLRRLRARIAHSPDRVGESTFKTIAAKLGVSLADVEIMNARLDGSDVSLSDALIKGDKDSGEYIDFVTDKEPLPDEIIDSKRLTCLVNRALGVLSERERNIIRRRKMSDASETLETIGNELGISKERVRQIESRALYKLRRALLQAGGEVT